jgi:heme/copper-type cytochrome/quinol oxidase subunit 2
MISEMTTETTRGVDKVTTATTRGVDKAIVIAVSVLAVCGVVLIVVLFWLRKCRAGNGKQ